MINILSGVAPGSSADTAAERYSSILNVMRVLTFGTSTGWPSTTRGLYLNFNTAWVAARSNRLLVENRTTGSLTVPAVVTVNPMSTYPSTPRDSARAG